MDKTGYGWGDDWFDSITVLGIRRAVDRPSPQFPAPPFHSSWTLHLSPRMASVVVF